MEKQETVRRPHVLLLPFPVQGHINPMLQFSKRLIAKGVEVTILTFSAADNESNVVRLGAVKFETIFDDGLDVGKLLQNMDAYLQRFKVVVNLRLPAIVARPGISCLVYDSGIPWALHIAKQKGVPAASFFTQSCAVNTICYNVHEGWLETPIPDGDSISMAGLPLLQKNDLPSFISDMEAFPALLQVSLDQFSNLRNADWVFINTFESLEEKVLNWMASQMPIKVIGPTIPSKYLDKRLKGDNDYGMHLFKPETDVYINWLNSKETGSVIYVSFGSLVILGEAQIHEIATGLKRSDHHFLWVVRETEQSKLPPNFKEEVSKKGLVVSWSRQLEVLAHKAVGCFMSHCGWNSTLEALSLGVPVVALPQLSDQTTNAKFIADVWRMGIKAKKDEKGIIAKEEIERCIREIMDGDKSEDIKKNSTKWKKLAIEAGSRGGSSDKNIEEFVAKLTCE